MRSRACRRVRPSTPWIRQIARTPRVASAAVAGTCAWTATACRRGRRGPAAPSIWQRTSPRPTPPVHAAISCNNSRVDLLVLEDFGMKKLGANAAEDLLEAFVRPHDTASTLITTNRPTQDWGVFLGDVARGHRDSGSLPRARRDRTDGRQELSPAATNWWWGHVTRPWTLPVPWTPRTRPPHLGNRCAIPTSAHRNHPRETAEEDPALARGHGARDTRAAYRVAAFQTFLSGRISTFGDIVLHRCSEVPRVGC